MTKKPKKKAKTNDRKTVEVSSNKCLSGNNENVGDDPNEMGANLATLDYGSGIRPIQLGCGHDHSCALFNDTSVKCWGHNGNGQLGYGDTYHRGDNPNEMGDNLPRVDFNYRGKHF